MAQHRVVCTDQVPVHEPNVTAHIVAVGTGTDPNRYSRKWTLAEVLAAIDNKDVFYTIGETSGRMALVQKVVCRGCGRWIIRSAPDAVKDNNLDYLRRCRS